MTLIPEIKIFNNAFPTLSLSDASFEYRSLNKQVVELTAQHLVSLNSHSKFVLLIREYFNTRYSRFFEKR